MTVAKSHYTSWSVLGHLLGLSRTVSSPGGRAAQATLNFKGDPIVIHSLCDKCAFFFLCISYSAVYKKSYYIIDKLW